MIICCNKFDTECWCFVVCYYFYSFWNRTNIFRQFPWCDIVRSHQIIVFVIDDVKYISILRLSFIGSIVQTIFKKPSIVCGRGLFGIIRIPEVFNQSEFFSHLNQLWFEMDTGTPMSTDSSSLSAKAFIFGPNALFLISGLLDTFDRQFPLYPAKSIFLIATKSCFFIFLVMQIYSWSEKSINFQLCHQKNSEISL